MPDIKRYNTARKVTGSKATDEEINVQYMSISSQDKFLLVKSLNKILKRYNVSIEIGWELLKDAFDNIALEYLIDSATAYCIYLDWKSSEKKKKIF